VIEEVKRRVPIWKKEFYSDGTVGWVDTTTLRQGGSAARQAAGASSSGT
jgi:molybdopterin synthase catalytic subunit